MVPFALLVPLSVGYAIVQHNIFDVDVFIRRSASYLIASGMAISLLFAITGLSGFLLQKYSGQSSQLVAVIATLLMVGIFRPLRVLTEKQIDKRFFREKYEYQNTIKKAGRALAGIIELDQLLNQMLYTLIDAMKIERGMILLKEKDRPAYKVAAFMTYHDTLKPVDTKIFEKVEAQHLFSADHPIYKHLETEQKPIMINDIEEMEEFKGEREALLRYMYNLEILLLVPVIYEKYLIGILGLAAKKSFEWYSNEDIELLQTLMMQMAVSIENAGKVEDLKKMVELETSYKELQRINEMKDNFLAMVSHDLRTPMTSIRGYASFMNKRPDQINKDTMVEYSGIIIEETERLTRLINDILDLQRFEAGRMELGFEDLEINVLLEKSLSLFQSVARERNLSMEKDIPDHGIRVKGDPDRLLQVMANLLSNATKFTPEGGKIKTAVSQATENGATVLKVSVSDTGDGIPKELQPKLFMKFQHADKLTKKKGEGTGLGLALVKEIIEYHGGTVGVESEPGCGSTFYFTLPIPE
jgi:signal transduction histidine kinase